MLSIIIIKLPDFVRTRTLSLSKFKINICLTRECLYEWDKAKGMRPVLIVGFSFSRPVYTYYVLFVP